MNALINRALTQNQQTVGLSGHLQRHGSGFNTEIVKRGFGAAFPPAERMRDFRMSRQDVGESRAAPRMARPGGPQKS